MNEQLPSNSLVADLKEFHTEIVECDGGRESGQMRMTREAFETIERLQQRVAELERSEDQLIGERDRAEDALQETHIALGGDGEWVGRSPPQSAPESGDLVLDVPELARERFTELERLRAPSPPAAQSSKEQATTATNGTNEMNHSNETQQAAPKPSSNSRLLLDRAVDAMATLHRAFEPMEDVDGIPAMVSPEAVRTFVDTLAEIDYQRCRLGDDVPPSDARLQALEKVYQKASELIAFIGHNGEAYSTHGQVEDLTCALDDCDRSHIQSVGLVACADGMRMKAPEMHSEPHQKELRPCAFCGALFPPVVPWQEFCRGQHRTDYNRLRGTMGRVVTVRRLMKGKTSITLHFSGPAAESALKLANGEHAYLAKANRA